MINISELPNIDKEATGENIVRLMRLNHVSMYDLQMVFRFQSATNIYSWRQGKHLPSAENLVKMAYIFHCKVDDIIVLERSDT